MKFRQGLDPSIQSRIALLLDGRPKDNDPPVWYTAARTVALTCAANEAFQGPRVANNSLSPSTGLWRVGEPQARFTSTTSIRPAFAPAAPAPVTSSGAAPMEVDLVKRQFTQPLTCQRCGKVGHFAWECPQAYDVRYMTADEREEMLPKMSKASLRFRSQRMWRRRTWRILCLAASEGCYFRRNKLTLSYSACHDFLAGAVWAGNLLQKLS
jgi:Zinc knuckle